MPTTAQEFAFDKHIIITSPDIAGGPARRYLCRTCPQSFDGSAQGMADAGFRLALYRIAVDHAMAHETGGR